MTDGIKPQHSTPGAATRQRLCVSLCHPLLLSFCLSASLILSLNARHTQLSGIDTSSQYTGRCATSETPTNRGRDGRSRDSASPHPVRSLSKDTDVIGRTRAGAMTVSMSPYVLLSC